MTDQQTTTAEPAARQSEAAEPTARQTEAPREPAAEQPAGTRELRDAQQASERSGAGTAPRPAIKASDGGASGAAPGDAPLFDDAAGSQLRERWLTIQTEFVDEPRNAVEKADALVAEVLKQLTDTFAREREELEAGWSSGGVGSRAEVSTEDLRVAIQRYRSFFNRLLTL